MLAGIDPGLLGIKALGLVMAALAVAGFVAYRRAGQYTEEAKYAWMEQELQAGKEEEAGGKTP